MGPKFSTSMFMRTALIAAALGSGATLLTGCFPVVATSMVAGALAITDRRTAGAQAEDAAIEIKAFNRFRERLKSEQISLTVTSFNRIALLTGYVPSEQARAEAAQLVQSIDNVRSVINEVAIGPAPSVRAFGVDTVLTARVKASLLEAKDVQANVIKVYTDASTVYLMGVVTEREAKRATDIASRVTGVRRVIRAFEVISEEELARIQLQTGGAGNAAPVSAPPPSARPLSASPATPAAPSAAAPAAETGAVVTPIR